MSMLTINTHEAKTQLSRLLVRVSNGEEIIIARSGKPVAKLVPVKQHAEKRRSGADIGKAWIAEDFDAPLPDDLQTYFEWRNLLIADNEKQTVIGIIGHLWMGTT